jgi:hypothetical protein
MKIIAFISLICISKILDKPTIFKGFSVSGDSTIVIPLQAGNEPRDNCMLVIDADGQNLIFKIMDVQKTYLYDASGCGGCELSDNDKRDNIIRKVKLDKSNKFPEFVITTPVHGSTYGAEYLFIIWHESNNWHILKTNFHRFIIKDINKDGYQEIIDYSNTDTGIAYNFENGLLKRAKQ